MRFKASAILTVTAFALFPGHGAKAQDSDFARLMAMDLSSLQGEIQTRYDAGLAASLSEGVIAADDARYVWALEAKVQCGIALGFLKSSTRDDTSIRNCQRAHALMTYAPPPTPVAVALPPPPPPPQSPAICNDEVVAIVFFEFDSAQIASDTNQTLDSIIANIPICGWRSFQVVGHTDQAGTDAYNIVLSQERADAVVEALQARGVARAAMTSSAAGESNPRVPLPDGTRSPQNRRVEISAD
ncbi:hypothetical protein GCM10009127_26310 [Alteraurantiacibacter aestuarii]|uniref:OmpA family protein n=1 Tax=Alteraurantiacibacter aestuarii TaxID=650004 RepID=UPI0031D03148